jgi:hypothetical protein
MSNGQGVPGIRAFAACDSKGLLTSPYFAVGNILAREVVSAAGLIETKVQLYCVAAEFDWE